MADPASTLTDVLALQDELVEEAALALPHQFSDCSYPLGQIRQAIYLCLTCSEPRGICSSCSIACHTEHEQVELFPKRNFRCDCPTSALAHPCTLHKQLEDVNSSNIYGQNFKGLFCRCGRSYDPNTERETMIQCLACEDWFHESCCNLRERPSSREPTPVGGPEQAAGAADELDDSRSNASSSCLPPPLINGSEYESFVCAGCVATIPILQRYAGTHGAIMVIREADNQEWKRIENSPGEGTIIVDDGGKPDIASAGMKRTRTLSNDDTPAAKKPRASSPSLVTTSAECIAPPPNPLAQAFFYPQESDRSVLSSGDIFLTEGFRDRWCRCAKCLSSLEPFPFLLREEETYEPPEDPDSGLSLEELGMRALERLPRDRAIEGIHAYNEMKDDLKQFLRPFAQDGKIVNESDIRAFFDKLRDSGKGAAP